MNKLILTSIALMLTACSQVHYTRTFADGSKLEVSGYEVGTQKALSGFEYQTPEATVKIDSLDKDQVEGMKQVNAFIQAIVEGAVKGAK